MSSSPNPFLVASPRVVSNRTTTSAGRTTSRTHSPLYSRGGLSVFGEHGMVATAAQTEEEAVPPQEKMLMPPMHAEPRAELSAFDIGLHHVGNQLTDADIDSPVFAPPPLPIKFTFQQGVIADTGFFRDVKQWPHLPVCEPDIQMDHSEQSEQPQSAGKITSLAQVTALRRLH